MNSEGKCINCGGNHMTGSCDYPNFLHRCHRCLVTSLNGTGHQSPCYPENTVSCFRSDVYASSLIELFTIRFADTETNLFNFDNSNQEFSPLTDKFKYLSPSREGIFTASKTLTGNRTITYEASSVKRFSIIFAVFKDNRWRFRFRALFSPTDGILCFPMYKTFYNQGRSLVIPDEFKFNTVLVIGLNSPNIEFKVNFKVFCQSEALTVTLVVLPTQKK